jgi:hypothetical protein
MPANKLTPAGVAVAPPSPAESVVDLTPKPTVWRKSYRR